MTHPVKTAKHAVLWIDHHQAKLLQLDAAPAQPSRIRERLHPTGQHGSEVRSQHEFFGKVCDEIGEHQTVLVMASKTALADFRHYVDKHRPQVGKCIAGHEVVDHPTDNQIGAAGRKFFEL